MAHSFYSPHLARDRMLQVASVRRHNPLNIAAFALTFSMVLSGCSALSSSAGGLKPSYSDFMNIHEGMSCMQAKNEIPGEWKLDSSSTVGDYKTEMYSLTGNFWSISLMCQNNWVVMMSQFGLD